MSRRQLSLPRIAMLGLLMAAPFAANAAIVITEASSTGSSNGTYNADWFELTNTSAAAVNITGWKMDDSPGTLANAVLLEGVTSIDAGQSVVFLNYASGASASAKTALIDLFKSSWFGGSAPAGLVVGLYADGGTGLSNSGDAVYIFNSASAIGTSVTFSTGDTTGDRQTFDNAAGVSGGSIATLSQIGVNNAFKSLTGNEVGSPGNIAPVPLPAAAWLLLSGIGALGAAARRRSV